MKILQINTSVNTGSTGHIAEDIGKILLKDGHQSFIAAGFTDRPSASQVIKIGNAWDKKLHGLKTRIFDRHGFGSKGATLQLVKEIAQIKPDIIHLHNLHGYYLHIGVLFEYLKKMQLPVVWTLHDCWPFTGHCSHFDRVNCHKWKEQCYACPNIKGYPASFGFDNSRKNFQDKRDIFNGLNNLQIVTPSQWLANHVRNSFLGKYPVHVINNGIDLSVFKTFDIEEDIKKYNPFGKKIILGVASTWKKRKAFEDFIQLSRLIGQNDQIVLVGLDKMQIKYLPYNITGVKRTESLNELAALYSASDVFVNPTYVDNFPTTNLEALACGTPVITYNTGGSLEAIDTETGIVVEKGDIDGLHKAILQICSKGKDFYSIKCRERAVKLYNKDGRYADYLNLYKVISGSK